jgi:hypothetical protein
MAKNLKILFILMFFTSCIVQSPKYSTLEQVMSLQTGMSRAEVEQKLQLQPYDLKAYNDTSNVFIYVYRVNDRKTFSFNTHQVNGIQTKGKFVQLFITYSRDGKVISIESCSLCPDNLVVRSKIDFEKIFVFITITLPLLLIFFGLKL